MKLKSVTSLYVHWCTADTVKQFIGVPVPAAANAGLAETIPAGLTLAVEQLSVITRLQIWYALLYVVVEGYRELEEKDEAVDELLANEEMVAAMKGFQTALFHPQEAPLSDQLLRFMARPGSEHWPHTLNAALKRYLESRINVQEYIRHFTAAL
jgi:hypothetical protein